MFQMVNGNAAEGLKINAARETGRRKAGSDPINFNPSRRQLRLQILLAAAKSMDLSALA
jgi:hypothetical protein